MESTAKNYLQLEKHNLFGIESENITTFLECIPNLLVFSPQSLPLFNFKANPECPWVKGLCALANIPFLFYSFWGPPCIEKLGPNKGNS
jgi:hypothetical protein